MVTKENKKIIQGQKCVVVIGNGLDLHLGLESSFNNFFRKRLLLNDTFVNPTNNVLYLLLYLRFYCDKNPQFGFFRKESLFNINWMDVESFIRKVSTEEEMMKGMYASYLMACKSYIDYDVNYNYDSKAKSIANCLANRVKKPEEGYSIIRKVLFEDMCAFKRDFVEYLKKENSKINIDARKQFLENIINSVYGSNFAPQRFYVVNFNYTSIKSPYIEYNIHGRLDTDIVLGYDSSSSPITNTDIVELSKEWQKLKFPTPFSIDEYSNVQTIIFYGHSLGEQDYPYFFNVFDVCHLSDKKSIVKLYFCYSNYETSNLVKPLDKYSMNILKMINAYERSRNPNIKRNSLYTSLCSSGRLIVKEIAENEE